MACPNQNRHVIQREWVEPSCATLRGFDLIPDPARLFLTIPMADQAHLFALGFFGPQGLAQPPLIARDHARRGGQNMRGRAVILLELHHMGTGEIRLKPQDVAHLGPAPAIDRLVVVTDATNILVPLR